MSAIADLAELPVWVAWQLEMKDGAEPGSKPDKVPYRVGGGRASSTDPRDWGTRDKAAAMAERLPRLEGDGGVGIILTEIGGGYSLCGIDLDTCRNRGTTGYYAPWAQEVVEYFQSYTEISPSQTGLKIFFKMTVGDCETVRDAIRRITQVPEQTGIKWSRGGGGDHPPSIELYTGNRYFTVTEQALGAYPLRLVTPETVLWVIHEAGPRLRDNGSAAGARDGSRSGTAWRKGLEMHRAGASYEEFVAAVKADPETSDWAREKGEAHGGRELKKIWDKAPAAAARDTNDQRALGYDGWRSLIGDHRGGEGFDGPVKSAIASWVGKHGAAHPTKWLRTDIERAIKSADASQHTSDYIAEKIADLDNQIAWTVEREAQKPQKQSQGEAVAAIAARASLFHTPDGIAFVDLSIDSHRETYPVRSKAFKQWLSFEHFRTHRKPATGDALEQALVLTEGRARYEAPEREVHLRVARADGKIYLDLADQKWRAVEIDAQGWRIIESPPVRFRRTAGMLALPEPARSGDINKLRAFLNVDDDGFVLAVAWQLAALSGNGPYPPLGIDGESGAGKTSAGRFIRRVIDPSSLPSRSPPRSDHDLYVAAHNSYVLHFENISKLPDWLSDSLCRLATGGGFATRKLYEDDDEKLFSGMRPSILDGIDKYIERADLANRAVKITLEKVSEDKRRAEAELNKEFAQEHPGMLGALLDVVAYGLAELPNTKLDAMPRMADFALWVVACEGALWEQGTFMEIYNRNQDSMLMDIIEGDLVGDAVQQFMHKKPWNNEPFSGPQKLPTDHWIGTATELLDYLETIVDLKTKLRPEWPKNHRGLSAKLRRIKDGLQKIGVEVLLGNKNNRNIALMPVGAQVAQAAQIRST